MTLVAYCFNELFISKSQMNSAVILLEKEKNILETQLSEIKVLLIKCEVTSSLSLV